MKTEAQMRAIWAEDARTHPDTRGGMIAAYFAKGGRITQCPTRFVVVTRQAKGAR